MSYLPNMSKTYKEPQKLPPFEEDKSITFNNLPPASSLLNDRTNNPQTILKHYHYYAHAPPVLPGPSLLTEALQDERMLRSKKQKSSEKVPVTEENPEPVAEDIPPDNTILLNTPDESLERVDSLSSKKSSKSSRSSTHRKKTSRKSSDTRKKEEIAPETTKGDTSRPVTSQISQPRSRHSPEDTSKSVKKLEQDFEEIFHSMPPRKEEPESNFQNRAIQCNLCVDSDKLHVMPSVINSLLRTMSFLLQELNQETKTKNDSREMKKLILQIEMTLAGLCKQDVKQDLVFETYVTDAKRMQDISKDVQKYIKKTYGIAGEFSDKFEDKKRLESELFEKDYELSVLKEKIEDSEILGISADSIDSDEYSSPEITIQNNILENEQLRAEIEFSNREMKKHRQMLAEEDWEIKTLQNNITELKRKLASSNLFLKNDPLGKKGLSKDIASVSSKPKSKEKLMK